MHKNFTHHELRQFSIVELSRLVAESFVVVLGRLNAHPFLVRECRKMSGL